MEMDVFMRIQGDHGVLFVGIVRCVFLVTASAQG